MAGKSKIVRSIGGALENLADTVTGRSRGGPPSADDNIKKSRFWVQYLPVNDAYIALFGDTFETAVRIPLRHPEIPALGKRLNVTTPMDQKYGHERWEQLPKEQTLFSSLEEIDATLAKSGLWRDPQTNDIVGIENIK